MTTLMFFALFAFFSFTEQGRRIFATKACSWAVLVASALFVAGGAISLLGGNVAALLQIGCWGYMGYQATARVKPRLGWKSLLRLK